MILNKKEILEGIKNGDMSFTPEIDQFQVQPNSLDLRVGYTFYIPQQWRYTDEGRIAVRPDYLNYNANSENFQMIKLKPGQYFEILPNEFVIVSSLEKIELKTGNLLSILHPRSSMIRRGLVIESGVVDIFYKGSLMIPVFNGSTHPIRIYPGERIYQLVFHKTNTSLTNEEAQIHGVVQAKYHESTSANLESRTDDNAEIDAIKAGKIEDIKEKYKIGS